MEPKAASRTKYDRVVQSLREAILGGVYEPGQKMPTRLAMGSQLGVGMATIQHALDELREDGFVRAHPFGTFVVENPPHLCNYGLVMPAGGLWSRYYISLRQAAASLDKGETRHFVEYNVSQEGAGRRDFVNLCRDVAKRKLAGLIFAGDGGTMHVDSVLQHGPVPVVHIVWSEKISGPLTLLSENSFVDRAIGYLRSKGRNRIAHLHMDFPWNRLEDVKLMLRKRGVEVRDYWIQGIPVGTMNHTAANVVNLMMQLDDQKRPDALIIYDDNLVEHAVAGLLAAGVKVPEDIVVLAKWNYPSQQTTTVMPVVRLGLDCRKILSKALELLDMQQRGRKPPEITELEAKFEDEI